MFRKKEEEKQQEHRETLLEKMQKSKDQHGIAYVGVFNDKKIRIDEQYMTTMMKYANDNDAFDPIGRTMYAANESYSRECDFDKLVLNLSIGLLYSGKDMDDNKQIKPDAEPVNEIVRYYTSSSACYLDDKQTNTVDWIEYRGSQGFISYSVLVKAAEANGLVFNGPKTFEEFKEHILVGEPFDISLSASLNPLSKETQYIKTK